MNDLERQLRESLRARAEDAEPTPQLWQQVQRRRDRRRRAGLLTAVAGVAAAVVVGAVGIPFAIEQLRPDGGEVLVDPTPTDEPTVPEPSVTPSVPVVDPTGAPTEQPNTPVAGIVVGTDGPTVWIETSPGSGRRGDLHTFPSQGHSTVVSMAVRPGYTPDDLIVALLMQSEGSYDLRWLHYTGDGPAEVRYFNVPDEADGTYDISGDARSVDSAVVPAPVWSPDGRHLAWLEKAPDGVRLRTIGWSDGPGTGATADDNAAWILDGVAADQPLRLQDWMWRSLDGEQAEGLINATSGTDLVTIDVQRQGDGALAYLGNRVSDGLAMVDWAAPDGGDAVHDESDPTYRLEIADAGEGTVDLVLTVTAADDQGTELPLPAELERTNDPTSIWMNAADDRVIVGAGGRAWSIPREGPTEELFGPVWYADPIE